jgi:hypothetical protein
MYRPFSVCRSLRCRGRADDLYVDPLVRRGVRGCRLAAGADKGVVSVLTGIDKVTERRQGLCRTCLSKISGWLRRLYRAVFVGPTHIRWPADRSEDQG